MTLNSIDAIVPDEREIRTDYGKEDTVIETWKKKKKLKELLNFCVGIVEGLVYTSTQFWIDALTGFNQIITYFYEFI